MGNTGPLAQDAQDRLHSWKEIAQFLGRGVRTAQRWELERELPVYRTAGGKIGSVYAFKCELAEWMAGAQGPVSEASDSQNSLPVSSPSEADSAPTSSEPASAAISPSQSLPALSNHSGEPRSWLALAIAAAAAVVVVLLALPMLRVEARPGALASTPHKPSAAAVDLYLQGRFYWQQRTPPALERAIDLFTQAIIADPSYAQAYAGIADCYNLLREFSSMPPEEAYPRALAAARRAVQLDDSSAEAHTSLAFATLYWEWDWDTADREFRRAIDLKPDFVIAHHWYANGLLSRGRFADALREIDLAEQLDPNSMPIQGSKGLILILSGREQEGRALLQAIEAAHPEYAPPHDYLAQLDLSERNLPGFISEQRNLVAVQDNPMQRVLLAAAVRGSATGGYTGALQAMQQMVSHPPQGLNRDPYLEARFAGLRGRNAEALQLLELAYREHRSGVSFLNTDRAFVSLRSTPEFLDMAALRYPHTMPSPASGPTELASATTVTKH